MKQASVCEICGKSFKTSNKSQRFCSAWCRKEFYEDFSHGRPRKILSKTLRFEVFKRDFFQCVYCRSTGPLEIDHLIALSNSGTNEINNLITSCSDCNKGKHDKPLTFQEIEIIRNRIMKYD